MHARNLTQSIEEALTRKGFSFIEVISPCTTLYLRRNRLGDGVDVLQYYQENADPQARLRHPRGGHRLPGQDRHRQVRREGQADLSRSGRQALRQAWSATTTSSTARPFPSAKPRKKREAEARALEAERVLAEDCRKRANEHPGNQVFGIRRPGHHPLRPDHRQGVVPVRRQVRHHDPELRPGGARQRLRCAAGGFRRPRALPVHHPARRYSWRCRRRPTTST